MAELPTGTVTFLFTDIEGSTRLWEQYPQAMQSALARHDTLLRQAIEEHGGQVFKTVGDQICAAFSTGPGALAAALCGQCVLQAAAWGEVGSLQVRMALHTGTALQREGDYFGPSLNRVARLLAAGHGGQILLSRATADQVQDRLPSAATLRDLGAHRLRDLQQPELILQLQHPELPADFPPLRSLEAFAHNLPRQLTSFVGREQVVAEVQRLLTTTHLLTLTGAGGCGKTRLALQMAAELIQEYADGVWLVELAALSDPALVPQTVAATLGVREEPGRPLTATLIEHLRPRSLLLLLDNCEHLLSACSELAERLLRQCPGMRIVATSREALGIGGEQTYRMPSLRFPDPRQTTPPEQLQQYEAVQLFTDRAMRSNHQFVLTSENAPAVAQVCQRLDGIPLAIELAAARVKALPVAQVAAGLDDRFRLLTGGSRTALPRQQTLRALIDWSYDLLTDAEQALLRRLSVFAGGWTLAAAQQVGAGEGIEAGEVLDLLTRLVEKSLAIYEEEPSAARYRLLETVRQYARERLEETGAVPLVRGRPESGEAEAARRQHALFFLTLAEAERERPERLEPEQDNLRAALGWVLESEEAELGFRFAAALMGYWWRCGPLAEGRAYLTRLLALLTAPSLREARAHTLDCAGSLALLQGDYEAARAFLEENLAICEHLGQTDRVGSRHANLGWVAREQGDFERAHAHYEQSLRIARELGNQEGVADTLLNLGQIARSRGDHAGAAACFQESLTVLRQLGREGRDDAVSQILLDLALMAHAQNDEQRVQALREELLAMAPADSGWRSLVCMRQGHLLLELGDYAGARSRYEAGLALRRQLKHTPFIPWALLEAGHAAWLQGEPAVTQAHVGEALGLFQELNNKDGLLAALESLAVATLAQGRQARAARLAGSAAAQREALGLPGTHWWLRPQERIDEAIRAASLEREFAAAWAQGRAMSLEQAISSALEEGPDG